MPAPDPALRRPFRWVVLAAFIAVVGVTQMLWLNLAPILLHIQARFAVSELQASTLILIFPLLYVLLSVPAGAMVDRRGYRFTVGLGAVATAVFSLLRVWDTSFWILFAAQAGIAFAQPFVVNGISKLVADWFDAEQGVLATGLGTMGMFLGMAAGMATTPLLEAAVGFRLTMVFFFAVSAAAAAAFLALARTNRPHGAPSGEAEDPRFGPLFRVGGMLQLFAIAFLGIGAFNGLTTWIEAILEPHGIDSEGAGLVGGALIIGGIVGAVAIPLLSDLARRRKPFLAACAAAASVLLVLVCTQASYRLVLALGAALGFAFMPAFALLLDMSSQLAGASRAGAATGLIMLFGNAGGVAAIVAVPFLKGANGQYHLAVALLGAMLALATMLSLATPETYRRRA